MARTVPYSTVPYRYKSCFWDNKLASCPLPLLLLPLLQQFPQHQPHHFQLNSEYSLTSMPTSCMDVCAVRVERECDSGPGQDERPLRSLTGEGQARDRRELAPHHRGDE
jgi:hypothetical protein